MSPPLLDALDDGGLHARMLVEPQKAVGTKIDDLLSAHANHSAGTNFIDDQILKVMVGKQLTEMLQEAERRSAGAFHLKEGTLYPALHHMERAGLLKAAWRESDAGRARKYYSLTAKGRRQAESKRRQWKSILSAMRAILGDAGA